MNITTMVLVIVIVGGSPEWNTSAETQAAKTVTYDEFRQLPEAQRDSVYAILGAENKAELLRSRFQRWLDEHRATLTSRQVSAVREVIESVTPELFRAPQDPKAIQRQLEMSHKLYCALGSELAYSFANDKTPAQPAEHSWTQTVHTWIDWMVECVAK